MPTRLEAAQVVGGRFRLLREVGRGAAGSVWQVRNITTDRDFALKVLHAETGQDPAAVRRFLNEARAAGRLRHPNVVEVYDTGELDDGTPYQVMELLEGRSLGAKLREGGPLPALAAVRIARDIALGLAAAHACGIVHRDVKPENIFVCPGESFDVARLVDFGVSKLEDSAGDALATREGALLGSPAYMSPEQIASAADVDARADIWAVGVVLYRCLAGRVPFPQRGLRELAFAITTAAPPSLEAARPDVSRAICDVVDRCLAKAPADRFQTADALARALDLALDERAGPASSLRATPRAHSRRRKMLFAGAATVLVGALSVLGFLRRTEAGVVPSAGVGPASMTLASQPSPSLPALGVEPRVDDAPPQVAAPLRTTKPIATPTKVHAGTSRGRAARPSHEGVTEPGF